jgi:hypothetical protein
MLLDERGKSGLNSAPAARIDPQLHPLRACCFPHISYQSVGTRIVRVPSYPGDRRAPNGSFGSSNELKGGDSERRVSTLPRRFVGRPATSVKGHGPSSPLSEMMVGNGVDSGGSGRGPRYRSFGMGCASRIGARAGGGSAGGV